MTNTPRVWALLGAHAGDNNQILALAEALGLPFEIKQLYYNAWRHLGPHLLGRSLRSLSQDSRRAIAGDPPDLAISAGHRSVPVVLHLRRASGGRVRSVHVGYPRISPDHFDLVVATEEYPVRDSPSLMRIPFALTRIREAIPLEIDFPSPRRLLILGGPTLFWRLEVETVITALKWLVTAASTDGGSVIAVSSPRTPKALLDEVRRGLAKANVPTLVAPVSGPPSYPSLLATADQLFVTADSVAMASDAIATRKPVGLIPIAPTAVGRAYSAMLPAGTRMRPRDLRFFWKRLHQDELVGTVDAPRAGAPPDINSIVAMRVRELLSSA